MKIIVSGKSDYTRALAIGKQMYKRLKAQNRLKASCYFDYYYIEAKLNVHILLVELVSKFAIVKHKNPSGFYWNFLLAPPKTQLPSGIANDGSLVVWPCIPRNKLLYPEYNQLSLLELINNNIIETYTFPTPILVMDGSWVLNTINVDPLIEGKDYGLPSTTTTNISMYYMLYQFGIPRSGFGADAYDTTEQDIFLKQLLLSGTSITQDTTSSTKAVIPSFLNEIAGIDYFTYKYNNINHLIQLHSTGTHQHAFDYQYNLDTSSYEFIDCSSSLLLGTNRTVHYYSYSGGILTDEGKTSNAEFKKTTETYHRFFSHNDSAYIYRINYNLVTFVPKQVEVTYHMYNNKNALLSSSTTITVDKLSKDTLAIVESYNLSTKDSSWVDRRLNKTFAMTYPEIGTDYTAEDFGVRSSLYVNNISTVTNTIGNTLDVFNSHTTSSDAYIDEHNEGFCCVLPIDGVVIKSGDVEYPIIAGRYLTQNQVTPSGTVGALLFSDEAVVCLLTKVDTMNTTSLHPNIQCRFIGDNVVPSYITNRELVSDELYVDGALATLPPSNYQLNGNYSVNAFNQIKYLVSNGTDTYFSGYSLSSQCPSINAQPVPFEGYITLAKTTDEVPIEYIDIVTKLSEMHFKTAFTEYLSQNSLGSTTSRKCYFKVTHPVNATYTTKMYICKLNETSVPTEVIYNGVAYVTYTNGTFSLAGSYDHYVDLPTANWKYIPTGYCLFFDAQWASDQIVAYQGV